MSTALLDEVKKHRQEIKHEVLSYGLSELVTMYHATPREINIQPDWQRLFRWSREQQCSFIESLILEVPIPPLFFFEAETGQWELLDGLQRVSTILKFMGTSDDVPFEYQGSENNELDWHYETLNDITKPLQLQATDYLKALEGLTFARLPAQLKLNLKRARIQIYVLKRETHSMYKYEVFKRLNRGGSRLEEQELRNCAIRLLDPKIADFIRDAAQDQNFASSLAISEGSAKAAYAEELVLRFFTMKNHGASFRHDVSEHLTMFMEEVAKGSLAFDFEKERVVFTRTWTLLAATFPDRTAFQAKRNDNKLTGLLSPALFELVSLAVAYHLEEAEALRPEQLSESLNALRDRAKDDGFTGDGSNSKRKTLGRLELAKNWTPGSS